MLGKKKEILGRFLLYIPKLICYLELNKLDEKSDNSPHDSFSPLKCMLPVVCNNA